MKTTLSIHKTAPLLLCTLLSTTVQAARFDNIQIQEMNAPASSSIEQRIDSINDPQFWLAWDVEAQPGVRSLCCWSGKDGKYGGNWSDDDKQLCNLDSAHDSFGSHKTSPEANRVTILTQIESGQITGMLTVGDACTVTGPDSTVHHAGLVSADISNTWLAQQVTSSKHASRSIGHHALSGIAMTAGPGADELLYGFAAENARRYSSEATFWMGELRQDAGLTGLKRLYDELPAGSVRKSINFALSVNGSRDAIDQLVMIAQQDDNTRQRGDALFWLAQSATEADHGHAVHDLLLEAIDTDPSSQVREQALHGLSELDTDAAADALIEVAREHESHKTRGTALFWLAQSYPDQAESEILDQMSSLDDRQAIDQAVFALSQLPDEQSTDALLKLIRGDYSKATKRQALFWLAQSDDPKALAQMESILQQ